MNTKKTIQKILFVALWVVIGGGMLTLLIAAMGNQKKNTCKDYTVIIKGEKKEDYFLGKSEIIKILKASAKGNIKGQAKASFNLQKMENLLERNEWIKDAQVYFDHKDVLHVTVEEREPVARIFTPGGMSFYIDGYDRTMKLSTRTRARVPVFTGFPDKKITTKKDSLLLQDVRRTATFINNNSFWASQVAQVDMVASDVADSWEMEMVPVIGNHIVKLGNGENIEEKFNRLFIFYKQVLARSGFDKYKTVDVRYDGQVIGGKSENPKVDSVALRKSVENLLQQIKKIEKENEDLEKSMAENNLTQSKLPSGEPAVNNPNPNPAKNNSIDPKPKEETKRPKAVMK